MQLLVGNDHVDVVLAPQTVIGHRQQAVDVGREVNARDRGALVQHHVQEPGILVRETVVVLPPNRRSDQQVQRGDLLTPGQMVADGQPLGVLVEHGIDDVDEGFVGGEEAVTPGEQIAFQHAFHGVLAEHFDNASVSRQFAAILVFGEVFGDPEFLGCLVDRLQFVRGGFVRAEHAEVSHVRLHHVAQEVPQGRDILGFDASGLIHLQGVIAEVRQTQRLLEDSAIGMRVGAHAAVPGGREFLEFRNQLAILVKQLLGLLVAHPLLEDSQLFGIFLDVGQRHLVGPPKTFEPVTAYFLRCAPAFRRAQHDHRPARSLGHAGRAAFLLMLLDLADAMFHGGRHGLVHAVGIGALHEVRRPAVARVRGSPTLRG